MTRHSMNLEGVVRYKSHFVNYLLWRRYTLQCFHALVMQYVENKAIVNSTCIQPVYRLLLTYHIITIDFFTNARDD